MAQKGLDNPLYQSGPFSFLHGMSGTHEDGTAYFTPEQGQALTDAWIRYNFNLSQQALSDGRPDWALFHFGLALHPSQDTTSPAHNDYNGLLGTHTFMPWRDKAPLSVEIPHVASEAHYPGDNSNLARATRGLFDMFFNQQSLPSTPVFNTWGVDPVQKPPYWYPLYNFLFQQPKG